MFAFEESYEAARALHDREPFELAYQRAVSETRRMLHGQAAGDIEAAGRMRAFEDQLRPAGDARGAAPRPVERDAQGDRRTTWSGSERLCAIEWLGREELIEAVDHDFSMAFQNVNYAAVSPWGQIYVVYGFAGTVWLRARLSDGRTWRTTSIDTYSGQSWPGVFADPALPGVVWVAGVKQHQVYVWRISGIESSGGSPTVDRYRVSSSSTHMDCERPSLAVDAGGTVHVAFTARKQVSVEGEDGSLALFVSGTHQVFYARLLAGDPSFEAAEQLSDDYALQMEQASVAVTDGTVFVVWRTGDPNDDDTGVGEQYRFNADAATGPSSFGPITAVPTPAIVGASEGGAVTDPSAWATPDGRVFTGFHGLRSTVNEGPWIASLNTVDPSPALGHTADMTTSTTAFRRGRFVHGAGSARSGSPFCFSMWVGLSTVASDYERLGLYGSVGCPGPHAGLTWTWHELDGDLTEASDNDVVVHEGAAQIEGVLDPKDEDFDRAYQLTLDSTLTDDLVGATVTFSGDEGRLEGRFEITEQVDGTTYLMGRLSGQHSDDQARAEAGTVDRAHVSIYSAYRFPNQPSLAVSSTGQVVLVWLEGSGPRDPAEAIASGETPEVRMLIRYGEVTT